MIAFEIARLSSQVPTANHDDNTGFFYKGNALSYFVDVLFVLLDNAVTKSGLDRGIWVDSAFQTVDGDLQIMVVNNCRPIENIIAANEELNFYRQHYGKESYALQAAQGEGGSGFFKVWKALTKDLELPHKIEFGYITIDSFEVKITIELQHLSGVLFNENSSS